MRWINNHIEVDPPKNPKKITGTRFAAVLGENRWKTPFQVWCEMTRTYEEPFTDNIYTIAGKKIEPKQAEYMHSAYGLDVITPEAKFGKDSPALLKRDFFNDDTFGGMWDYLTADHKVLEMKTTKRAEDWADDIPEYYALQCALYGYLLGYDDCVMVATLLDEGDYDKPEEFVPSIENTFVVPFKLADRYPDFENLVEEARAFYDKYVLTGISPDYDEEADAEYLKALRTKSIDPSVDVKTLIAEAQEINEQLAKIKQATKPFEDRLDVIKKHLKKLMMGDMTDDIDTIELGTDTFKFVLSKSTRADIDTDRLKADGIYATYAKTKTTYTLRTKETH